MQNVAELIDKCIAEKVWDTLYTRIRPELPEYIATDSVGEVIEKLCILHIRTWMLEDAIQLAKTDAEIADLKRKVDQCFKVKRPKFVAAINAMIDDAIVKNKSLVEDSVKLYKGVEGE